MRRVELNKQTTQETVEVMHPNTASDSRITTPKGRNLMRGVSHWVVAAMFTAVLPIVANAGGGKSIGKESGIVPAHLEKIEGSTIKKVTLTADGAKRLGLELAGVEEKQVPSKRRGTDSVSRLVVPYASLIYTPDGAEWVYTSPANLTFVRERIEVAYVQGNMAVLNMGPKAGVQIVTTGAAEVYGAESGLGH
jgi:hypothetical protein